MDIIGAVSWVVEGGGAGVLAYWVMGQFAALENLRPDYKRLAAWALSSWLGIAAWAVLPWLGTEPWPATPQAWASELFRVAFLAASTSQLVHGFRKLPKTKRLKR